MLTPRKVKFTTQCLTLACAMALAASTTRADEQIHTYTVPKDHPALAPTQTQLGASAPASDIPISAAPIQWTLPDGWQELAPDSIRLGNFAVPGKDGGKAAVAVTSFPGSVGTELANFNRWRGQVGLAPVEADGMSSQPVTVDAIEGKLFDVAGASQRIVVAMIPRNGATWFFKMIGDAPTVAAANPAFLDFLKSVHFKGAPDAASAADPHAGLPGFHHPQAEAGAAAAAADAPVIAPKWDVPRDWVEQSPGPMIFKSFALSDSASGKADVTVSFFPGDVGGVAANVNRWRGQLGLPPVDASQLAGATESLDTAGGKATLVDLSGTDKKTGNPARLVGVIVPHGDNTWFYKMWGDGSLVAKDKDSFVQFVKSVHYP